MDEMAIINMYCYYYYCSKQMTEIHDDPSILTDKKTQQHCQIMQITPNN